MNIMNPESPTAMMLGSPCSPSPSSPLVMQSGMQSPYLPQFLLGDTPSVLKSPQRLWMSPSSPQKSVKTTPLSSKTDTLPRDYSQRKNKSGVPPVSGLFDQITTPVSSPYTGQFQKVDMNNSHYDTSLVHTPNTRMASSGVPRSGFLSSGPVFIPSSPTQIDPFYTQGEAITPDEVLDETWITIFGFPPASTSFILEQFSQYGNIVNHVISAEGNWMHLHYQSKIQAKKALSKNGKVFGNGIMVGVQMCIDKSVKAKEQQRSFIGTPVQNITSSNFNTPIRPLTAAYKAASSDHQVTNDHNTPQKNSSLLGKAMEYMFGW